MLACGWKTAGFFCAFLSGVCVLGRAINFLLNVFKSYFPLPESSCNRNHQEARVGHNPYRKTQVFQSWTA